MNLRFLCVSIPVCALGVVGCGGNETKEATNDSHDEAGPIFQYLQGTSETTSPNGAMTYESVDVLAKRTIDSGAGTIVEDTVHGDEVRTTFFTLQAGTLIFDVADEENTFSGTVTFESEDWLSSNATYNIELLGQYPGTLTGTGVWEADTYITEKEFANPAGTVESRTTEVLTVISEAEYSAALPE